jgi:CIC family chloride channel protein
MFYSTKKFFSSIGVPKLVKPAVGAALTGIAGIFFPQILGLGYGFLQYLMDGKLNMIKLNYLNFPCCNYTHYFNENGWNIVDCW